MQLALKYHKFCCRKNTYVNVYVFRTKLRLKLIKQFVLFTIYIVSMINRNLFMDFIFCRNMYDELTSNENANQYEVILKKGSAN